MERITDPWTSLDRWYAEAEQTEPRVPDAAQLATVGPEHRPSVRTVLVKEWSDEGLVFYTNYTSRKAAHLDAIPWAALCFHWKALERQVQVEGHVHRLDEALSDAYWRTRPRGSQIGAWASDQSSTLATREALTEAMAEIEARFEGREVPRPPHWGGYRLVPDRVEFWQGRQDRLHERVELRRTPDGWDRRLLHP